ncbi:MAG: chromate transporter [Erysipelotrichaceae bacterium]|nr:chromate transporter [Erysipelotrichaceae bacterium]
MLQISTFTFGGGFVIIGMMRKKFCDELHYVTDDEVLDMTAIAQSSPGALAVNSAIIFCYRIKGIKGACISALATVIPPIVIISVISFCYEAFSTNYYIQIALQVMWFRRSRKNDHSKRRC